MFNVTGSHTTRGTLLVVEPGRRLVYTWLFDHVEPPLPTTVEVTLTPLGRGTRVHLHHHSFVERPARDRHAGGWAHYLPRPLQRRLVLPVPRLLAGGCRNPLLQPIHRTSRRERGHRGRGVAARPWIAVSAASGQRRRSSRAKTHNRGRHAVRAVAGFYGFSRRYETAEVMTVMTLRELRKARPLTPVSVARQRRPIRSGWGILIPESDDGRLLTLGSNRHAQNERNTMTSELKRRYGALRRRQVLPSNGLESLPDSSALQRCMPKPVWID